MSVQKLPVPRKRKRTRLPRTIRREQILDAATQAFCRGGYHGTSVDDVIRAAGIARGTFYLYFDSKHAVFAALVDRMLRVFLESSGPSGAADMTSVQDARRILRGHYRALLDALHRHRELCRLLFEEAAGADKGFDVQLDAHRATWQKHVRDRIQTMRDLGFARRDVDVDAAAWCVVGAVEMLVRQYVLRGHEPDLDRLADALVEHDLRGIAGRP
jgi:AcrR family transcriptional regulator